MRYRLAAIGACALALVLAVPAFAATFYSGGANVGLTKCSGGPCPGNAKSRNGQVTITNGASGSRNAFVDFQRPAGTIVAVAQTGFGGTVAGIPTYITVHVRCGNNGNEFITMQCDTSNP